METAEGVSKGVGIAAVLALGGYQMDEVINEGERGWWVVLFRGGLNRYGWCMEPTFQPPNLTFHT